MAIRQFIRDAFKCDELVHQFKVVDVEDGLLKTGTEKEVSENKLYTDRYIIEEAKNRLELTNKKIEQLNEETDNDATYRIELEFLENKVVKDLDENSYHELLKLKSQLNRE